MHYTISCPEPQTHLLHIVLTVDDIRAPTLTLQLPAWRPGRYELANYAQNIKQLRVCTRDDQEVPFIKTSKDKWQIQTPNVGSIQVHYQYYAAQMDAGSSWADATQWYINFNNCALYNPALTQQDHTVNLVLPEGFVVACGLEQPSYGQLKAPSHYHLAASPLVASPNLEHYVYQVEGHAFHVWLEGQHALPMPEMIDHFEAFTRTQLATMGHFPCKDYHFIFQLMPHRAYHGVEYFNSTVIVLGPQEQMHEAGLYNALLGVSSHELYHTWNIVRIRPAELTPYNFKQENYFRTGFVAEGVTTYYGDLFLVRSGVKSQQWYFDELNTLLKRHYQNFGRLNLSVADSSFDLWLDGYKAGIPNRKSSIYVEGAVAALILDLLLRKYSHGQESLDSLMRQMWQLYNAEKLKGYTYNDYVALAEKLAGTDLTRYFNGLISSTEVPSETFLEELSGFVGCTWQRVQAENLQESAYGFRTVVQQGVPKVVKLDPAGSAYTQLSIDDELVAINGKRVNGTNAHDLLAMHRGTGPVELTVFRQDYLMVVRLEAAATLGGFGYYQLVPDDEATQEALAQRQHWLQG